MNQGAAFCDRVAARLDDMFSRPGRAVDADALADGIRGLDISDEEGDIDIPATRQKQRPRRNSGNSSILSFRKAWLYQNSRLPPVMLPSKF
jgi:hypothetical protein